MKKFVIASIIVLSATSAQAYDKGHIVFGLGANNVFDQNDGNLGVNAEYRMKQFEPSSLGGVGGVSPMVGLDVSSDSEVYAYGGFLYDWNVGSNFHIVPSIAAGLYHEGDGRDLGNFLNFRSTIEGNYELDGGSRVGLQLSHISNASIGDRNPGTEHLKVNYSFPTN